MSATKYWLVQLSTKIFVTSNGGFQTKWEPMSYLFIPGCRVQSITSVLAIESADISSVVRLTYQGDKGVSRPIRS